MQIEILTDNGTSIQLVRFFELSGKQFLIFLNNGEGADAQGHITIHISEVVNNGRYFASNIADADYENIKNIIKGIVNANKNNQPLPIQDLDYNTIDGIGVMGDRALKLMSNYVDLLKGNQPIFEKTVVENIITPTQENNDVFVNNPENNSFDNFTNVGPAEPVMAPNTFEQQPTNVFEQPAPIVDNQVQYAPVEEPAPVMPSYDNNNMVNNGFENVEQSTIEPQTDYESLYNEQVQLVNSLQNELEQYRNKIETLKSIINN